ncbi:hypothetical protein M2277_004180 [Paenibacillus sp. LBL]|uniref:hypothetical protein n=1 Tax=Paenibacillus sp. LBL TaxID=2940563 RepID=UPI002473CBFB|nr:hypothetical protein [Paenibacillus sp. LBL]MDH6673515.1 hypothetical protein [Paenibacillus sp. LBL]
MTNPVTPNIGLNKIDRTSPSTTYFDLDKYIDQNADAVDQFAGAASEAIGALEKRLDTEERREVVLQPGLQIVNAERSAPFKLSGIKGRTLVNLLGRDGGFESVNRWSAAYQTSVMLDTGMKEGGSSSLKVSATGTASSEHYIDHEGIPVKVDAHYILVGMAKPSNNKSKAYMRIYGLDSNNQPNNIYAASNTVEDTASFKPVVLKFKPTAVIKVVARLQLKDSLGNEIYIQDGQSGNYDSIRIYEISATEYTALDSMTPEQIAAKYPYVDSVQPVRNPYVIRYGENLAPTLYEGTVGSSMSIMSAYSALIKATGSTVVQYGSNLVSAIPNTIYTLRAKVTMNGQEKYSGVYVDVMGYDNEGRTVLDTIGTSISGTGTGLDTFTTPANIKTMEVRIVVPDSAEVGDYVVKNIMLNIGSTPKPFKPREDSMLALQTDLYADPLTGANADEVFEKDGQYFKLAKWKKVELDGSHDWRIEQTLSKSGMKRVICSEFMDGTSFGNYAAKYDGKILGEIGSVDIIDSFLNNRTNGLFYIVISNTDSGWGDNYTPTADEIKAYFMGWKMYDGSTNPNGDGVYNRTDGLQKCWAKRALNGDFWGGVALNVPKDTYPEFIRDFGFYQLVYQLATSIVEPIVSEGMLTFNVGENQIEVGTGIVLRESAKPTYYSANGNYYINNTAVSGSLLKNKVSLILRVYRNGHVDNSVKIENDANAYGKQHVRFLPSDFNQSAAYSATYLMLDKLPISPLTGSYAASEKTMLHELTDAVQKNATTVSVLMNKKADNDAPGWITPTLLNGWVNFGGGNAAAGFIKTHGFVILKGTITAGAIANGTTILTLPEGYRPKERKLFVVYSSGNTGILALLADGRLVIDVLTSSISISLDNIVFLEE